MPVAVPGETEEGKGERASRISLHLRGLSRHRSVSPTSHRYRMAAFPLPAPSAVWEQSSALRSKTPELLPPEPKLHSPRPMLSPKASFTGEPLAGSGQSGRVAALERMVEEEERKIVKAAEAAKEAPVQESTSHELPLSRPIPMSPPSPELDARELNEILEKALPNPPVPSTKPKRDIPTTSPLLEMFSQRAHAAETAPLEKEAKASKPEVVMANLAPNRAQQPLPKPPSLVKLDEQHAEAKSSPSPIGATVKPSPAGLDALERRLLRDVGTRKQPVTVVQQLRELNEVTGMAIKEKVEMKRKLAAEPHLKPADGSVGATVAPSEDKEAAIHVLLNRKRRKAFDVEPQVQESGNQLVTSSTASQEEEVLRLRKEAKGRVTVWLGDAQKADPPPLTETRIIELAAKESPPLSESAGEVMEDTKSASVSLDSSSEGPKRVDPSKIQLPGRRSSGFLLIQRLAQEATPRIAEMAPAEPAVLERYKPGLQLPKVANYDVRSARGGRGGKVTSVAALWAEKAAGGAVSPPPKIQRNGVPLPVMVRQGQEKVKVSIPPVVKPAKLKEGDPKEEVRETTSPAQRSAGKAYPWFGPAISPARSAPANLIAKGASVPAKLSSSVASPTLSSTESLARPQQAKPAGKPAATIAERAALVQKPAAADPGGLIASASEPRLPAQVVSFGQARLRGLIAKYQGGGA